MLNSQANYNGRQPNNTSYIKNFILGNNAELWKVINYKAFNVITPSTSQFNNLYIPGNLYVDGIIAQPSDAYLKNDITNIESNLSNKILALEPSSFTFKSDTTKSIHYGFIAQEFEKVFPEMIQMKPDKTLDSIKSINYLEIVPLLVHKIQMMQKEIDILKELIK
jgi:hypothetical protein